MSEVKTKTSSYLTFNLGEEEFAAHVDKVLNILEMTHVTKVPRAPGYMKGVINLRGMVLPLVDTRVKFGMPETEVSDNTCILVLDLNVSGEEVKLGALVDSVQEVLELENENLLPPPSIGSKYKSEFIEGIANVDEKFIMVLNMDLIFSADDLSQLKETLEQPQAVKAKQEANKDGEKPKKKAKKA